jgi:Carboxypeptidase regulatory-like domain/TonB dependent receptor
MVRYVRPVFVILLGWAASASAQDATGHIEGRVLTAEASPAVSVRVAASSPNLQQSRAAETDARGYFRLQDLPVGTYQVRLALVGYRPVRFDNVVVRLGRTTSLGETRIEPQAFELQDIVVNAQRPLVDVASAATVTNLPAEQFRNIPTERNFRSIVKLAPQANASYYPGDEADVAGGTGPENAYFLDGVNITDPKLGATSSNLPYNFVRELQVKTGGYEAEFGRATGGIVDVVTYSGSNRFGGQLFGYFTNNGLTAAPRFEVPGTRELAFSEYDIGGSLGGPILKDRLWFFAAYNPSVRRQRVEVRGPALPDDYLIQHLFATKLTWQPGLRTDIAVTIHGDPSRHREFPGALEADSLVNPEAVTQETHVGGFVLSTLVRQRLGSSAQLEVGASRFTSHNSFRAATPLGRTAAHYLDNRTGTVSGGLGFDGRDNVARTGARASLLAVRGRHTVKVGVEYEANFLDEHNDFSGRQGSPDGLITRLDDSTWVWEHGEGGGLFRNRIPTAYAQDSWRVGERLTLNAGLRWDAQYLTHSDQVVQSFTGEWQPRLGFIYQLGVLGTQKLSGSFGRFYEQIPIDFMTAYDIDFGFYSRVQYSQDPRLDATNGDTLQSCCTFGALPQQDLDGQYFDEFTLGYERAIGKDFHAGVRGMDRTIRSVVEDVFDPSVGYVVMGNPGRGSLASAPLPSHRYTALVLTFEKPEGRLKFLASYVLSRTRGNYQGLYSFDQQGAFPNDGYQFDQPSSYPRSTGLLPNDHPHILKVSGSYGFDSGLTVGTALAWMSGEPRNEYGLSPEGFYFLRQRGTAGRAPGLFDAALQLAYALPRWTGSGIRPTLYLDLFNIGNPRTDVTYDYLHYLDVDENGVPVTPNRTYGRPRLFQPPMSARLGISLDFGELE